MGNKTKQFAIRRHDGRIFPERFATYAEAQAELDHKLGNAPDPSLAWVIKLLTA